MDYSGLDRQLQRTEAQPKDRLRTMLHRVLGALGSIATYRPGIL